MSSQLAKRVNVSDRVEYQLPEFIREDDRQFVNLLLEYYRSQEKTGRPYDVLNNIINYLDLDNYGSEGLSAETLLLRDIGITDQSIEVETIDGFTEKNGSILIDNEIIYYESVSRGPDAILTPGISYEQFKKKEQQLENPFSLFDGTRRRFDLSNLGTPVAPPSANHLLVTTYNNFLIPNVDYTVDGDEIVFTTAPRLRTGVDDSEFTQLVYLVGYADQSVLEMDDINYEVYQGKSEYPLKLNGSNYYPTSEIGLIVNKNGNLLVPFQDYVIFQTNDGSSFVSFNAGALGAADVIHIRSVEYNAPQYGSGAKLICEVNESSKALSGLQVKSGGSGYRLDFAPKVSIVSTTGEGAAARSLVGGIKDIQLISGGQGYTSFNPPIPFVSAPTNPNGSRAEIEIEVDDASGQVSSIRITNSGSGYDFIPAISFINPAGAKITDPTIDSEGRVNVDSIQVTKTGVGYKNAPVVYIDPAPEGGINAQATSRINSDGQVIEIQVNNRGRGYTTPPRARIIDPVGAQVLDVTVASGAVTEIEMLTGGMGYTDPPSVYIVDDRKDAYGNPVGGQGAKAVATIFNGEITDINITDFGSGYSDQYPPKIYIAEPAAAKASVNIGYDEVTGFEIIRGGKEYSPSALLGCARGVSDVIGFDDLGNQIYAREEQLANTNHNAGTRIVNLDSIFVKEVFDRFRRQYLPTLEINYDRINPVQVIKTIRDFYASKGTKMSTQYLFKILFGENVDVFYPKDEIISPSHATWVVDTILRAELISGDPRNLIDGQLNQYRDEVDTNIREASALIENVISIIQGTDTIYELAISEETLVGQFIIPYKTRLVEPLNTTGQIITVDSTIGWPERNGTILINDEEQVQYKEKSLNQFIECTRSKNGIVEDWDPGTIVQSDIFVYVNKDTPTECKLRILGIAEAGTTVLDDTGSYYLPSDKLKVASLGSSAEDERLSSWLYNVKKLIQVSSVTPGGDNNQTATVVCDNPHGLLVSDQVTIYGANPVIYNGTFAVTSRIDEYQFSYRLAQPTDIIPQGNILLSVDLNRGKSDVTSINKVVSEFTTNIQNSFFNDDYVYVAASGLPNYKIGPFTGSALIPGNQRKLMRFPRNVLTVSERQDIQPNTSIGSWVNGVSIWSYKSSEYVQFGPLTNITVDNGGEGYDAGAKPNLEIIGGGGTGAAGSVVVNGSLTSFDVTEGGSGYTDSPLISIVGGGGSGGTARAVVTGGRVTRILVDSPGTGYTSQPDVAITGGGGSGATATANVRGPISSVMISSFGSGYTSLPQIRVNSGENALAQPIVINGRIVSIAIINSGNSYTTAPNVIINGDGFGAIAQATIGTFGEDKGKVLSIQILNRGIGYTQGNTTVRLEAVGQNATFTPTVYRWYRNNQYDLGSKYDFARGYVFTGLNNAFGGEYAHLSDPKELRYVVGDNVFLNPVTQQFQELSSNFSHSPILGWAFDGNPIYGPYAYADPTDQNSGIRRMRTSYKLKTNVVFDAATNPNPSRTDGPPLSSYPAGQFVADYYYDFQSGDLDNYNGRFCKTPEYPDGVYAYFITVDASEAGVAEFPYILGPQFNSLPDQWNLGQGATQENIPQDVVRYRDPYVNVDIDIDRQPNQESDVLTTEIEGYPLIFEIQDSNNDGVIDASEQQETLEMTTEATLQIYDYFPQVPPESRVDIEVETTTQFEDAQIDGFVIENPGVSYQVNDTVFFNNEGTEGYGASAIIDSVKGQVIQAYQKEIIGDQPYGKITTAEIHDLKQQDGIIVNSRPIADNTNKAFKNVVVSGIETVSIDQVGRGYNSDLPPVYELITSQGSDAEFRINLEANGGISTVDILNSGNGYDVDNPPQIRVTHPQQYKKTRYWLSEYIEADGQLMIHDSKITSDRYLYICGSIEIGNGNMAGFLAKFDDLGRLVWERHLQPINTGDKRSEFLRMYINESYENDRIYVAGQTYSPTNDLFNPDIWVGMYESGFNTANAPDGLLQWQKSIAGISGTTRRDYITSISLDAEERIYLAGYTNTNSPDPDDIWVIQADQDGDVVEKRKFASIDGNERLEQIADLGNNRFFWVGVNEDNDDCLYGVFFYDGANLEMEYAKQVTVTGGYVRNPRFVIDEYQDVFILWDFYNNATSVWEKVQLSRISLANTASGGSFTWSKTIALTPMDSVTPISIQHAGLNLDEFGNISVVTDMKYKQNVRVAGLTYFKYDGTVLRQSYLEDTNSAGFSVKSHVVDSSGDPILICERQLPDQAAAFRFTEDGNNWNEDFTKRKLAPLSVIDTAASAWERDTTAYKWGPASLKLKTSNAVKATNFNRNIQSEWCVEGWYSMDSTNHGVNHQPKMMTVVPVTGKTAHFIIDGDSTSANYQKVLLYFDGVEVASSTTAYNWTTFASSAWVHLSFSKENPTVGSYTYRVFVNGVAMIELVSTEDIGLDDVYWASDSTPSASDAFLGNLDDLVVSETAKYTATYTVPADYVEITTQASDVAIYKVDRLHTERGDKTLTTLNNYTQFSFSENFNVNVQTVTNGAISNWEEGPGGLQILDMSYTIATMIPATVALSTNVEIFGSKTSTVPTPRGQKLKLSSNVVPKFYIRDALYSKIDNVKEFTFNQDCKFTKGSIIQQVNAAGVVQAYGTIVESPAGGINTPGLGTKYKVGKIFGTFNNTDLFKNDLDEINHITGVYFDTEEAEIPWASGTAYAQGDRVYSDKKIYEAQGAGTSGTITPIHTAGVASDGVINWAFIDDSGKFTIDAANHPYQIPEYQGSDMIEWDAHILYAPGYRIWKGLNVYETTNGGVSGTTPPTHTTGTVNDGNVDWTFVETREALGTYARFMAYDEDFYTVRIEEIQPGSTYIPGDVISIRSDNIEVDETEKILRVVNLPSVKKIRVTSTVKKDIIRTAEVRTDQVYATSVTRHNYNNGEILYTTGFSQTAFNGSFFVKEVFGSREFTFTIRDTAVEEPAFLQSAISNVNIYAKHPTLTFTRGHAYVFDLADPSNFGYYLSFSQDNQYKLEYSFNNITREGTPGVPTTSTAPFVKFTVLGDVTNISYYFDPSRVGANSPVGDKSFIDVIKTPYDGTFTISEIITDTEFRFPLVREPEQTSAEVGTDEFDNAYSYYSTTSTKAVGPINSIKLVSPGGFYKKLPIISDIASYRQIEKINITDGGTEYAPGVYYDVGILGDGEGAKATITVEIDDETGSGTITGVAITDPGKGYTTASIDIDAIPGILGPTLAGSGAALEVVIPEEGSGASVFLTGRNIGKIKRLKNNEFGYGYSHDYTLRPEISFPVNLQLFNTSILTQIKITNPGSGYTSAPAVVIEGGGGEGAQAEAIVKNNRLSEIVIKNPGQGYSSEPTVTLKSEFNYVVNLDLNYLQFNFPHGITTGAAVQFRADDVGTTEGELPKPSSVGLTSLVEGQVYYAIAGNQNSLESDQIRFALTPQAAATGDFITFLTQGSGRQVLLTEVFGGTAEAIVSTSRFLEGEEVFQGPSLEQATATAVVSTNTGWQIGPKILKLVNNQGDFIKGEKVTGTVSKASGVIDNLNIAKGVLNIGSLTKTPGKFIDDVGKPSEIVQKIQDSFFYQNFSYVIKSEIPITEWKTQILENNHPAGFNLFGQLQLTGGKDVSGRKIGTEFIKNVNIFDYANVNQITSFGAAQPIYTDYNNTEVLFRKRRLTSSEEILTSIVKKLDDISGQFDGVQKSFPLTVENESVIVKDDQLMITINGIIQSPRVSYSIVGGNIVFAEAPKPPSKVVYRNIRVTPVEIYRIELYQVGGIFPTLGQQIQGQANDTFATVIDTGASSIDVINITGTPFQLNEQLRRGTIFSALVQSVTLLNSDTIFEFGESITNLNGDTAKIEETNLDDGVVTDALVISKTSGTSDEETGQFNIRLNDYVYSASTKIAGQVSFISPYLDPNTGEPVDTLTINAGSTFFGLLFERLLSITNPNVVLDDISKSTITPTELYNADNRINADFLDFEDVRSSEVVMTDLTGGQFSEGELIRNKKVDYINEVTTAISRYYDAGNRIIDNRQEIIDFAEAQITVDHPGFYYPGAQQTDQWGRFRDAYRLIIKNKDLIVNYTYELMLAQFPSLVVPSADKCKRDLGKFIDAVARDTHSGGNVYGRKFTMQYFDSNSGLAYISSEIAETRWAYEKAKDLMLLAITNQLSGNYGSGNFGPAYNEISVGGSGGTGITIDPAPGNPYGTAGSNTTANDPGNCSDVQSAITTTWTYIDETLGAGNMDDLPDEVLPTEFTLNQTKCRRDIGIFVDAIVEDLKSNGNWGVVKFTKKYFDGAGAPISNGLVGEVAESITAFNHARTLMYSAINNLLYGKDLTITADPASYGGSAPGHKYDPNYANGSNQLLSNCADVKASIDTLLAVATTAISAGNLNNIIALEQANQVTDGTYTIGETIRVNKIAYQEKGDGLFFRDDVIKGVTSNASFTAIGVNTGFKWLFAGNVTGSFQSREYITNSQLDVGSGVSQTVINVAAGSKSLKFDGSSNSYINMPNSYDYEFGTDDFTIEGWYYFPATTASPQQVLFDVGYQTDYQIVVVWDTVIRAYTATNGQGTDLYNTANKVTPSANTWHHIALVKGSNVMTLYVDGVVTGQVGDTGTYNYGHVTIGASAATNAGNFNGGVDHFIVSNSARYTQPFTPSAVYDSTADDIITSFNNEHPILVADQDVYAKYTDTITANATATYVDYDDDRITIQEWDIGRQEYRDAADIIEKNAAWIAEEAVGRLKVRYPDFVFPGDNPAANTYGGTNYCIRDTRDYIIPAMVKDLRNGGNYNVTTTARFYLTKGGELEFIGNELLQTLYTWDQVADIAKEVITSTSLDLSGTYSTILRIPNNFSSPASQPVLDEIQALSDEIATILSPTGHRYRDAGDLIWKNKDYIADEAVGYIQDKYTKDIAGTLTDFLIMPGNGEPSCHRDLSDHVIPAIIGDLCTGGNANTQTIISKYLNNQDQILHVQDELSPMLDALHFCNDLAQKAINNLLLSPGETASSLGIDARYQDDYYEPQWTTRDAFRGASTTIDSKAYPQATRAQNDRFLDAADLLQANKKLIAHEAVAFMNDLGKYGSFNVPGGAINCVDDVVDILDAVTHDLSYDCNERTYDAAALYLREEDNALLHVSTEAEATRTVLRVARDMAILTMRNGFGRPHVDGNNPDFRPVESYEQNTVHQDVYDAYHYLDSHIRWIANESVKRMKANYPNFTVNGGAGAMWWKEFTPTNASYTASTGVLTLTIPDHRLNVGEYISLAANGITFTCSMDSNATNHPYPRNTDPAYEKRLLITDTTPDTLTINVGASPSGQQYDHTFVSAVTGAVRYGWNDGGEHFTPTAANYTASTGEMVLTIPNHSFNVGSRMSIEPHSLVFTCAMDNNQSEHAYPRNGDPAFGTTRAITAVGTSTQDITNATYDPVSGKMVITTSGNHGLVTGNRIKLAANSLTFTCTMDSNGSNHTYPRATDPANEKWLLVSRVDDTTFSCYVGVAANNNQYAHTFVSASAGALIKQNGTVTVNVGASPSNNQYAHTFVRAVQGGIISAGAIDCVHDVADLIRAVLWNAENGGDNYVGLATEFYLSGPAIIHVTSQVTETLYAIQQAKNIMINMALGAGVGSIVGEVAQPPANTFNGTSDQNTEIQNRLTYLWDIVEDTMQDPNGQNASTYPNSASSKNFQWELPNFWPIKYTSEIADRDLSITFDSANGGLGNNGTWNQTCPQVASSITTLMDIIDSTISGGLTNTNALAGITRTTAYSSNTNYQEGTCENVRSMIDNLFVLMTESLTADNRNLRQYADLIRFNAPAIYRRAYDETVVSYPQFATQILTYNSDPYLLGKEIVDAIQYDLITKGNAGAFKLIGDWFDGDGAFIAFPNIVRSFLLEFLSKVREMAKSVIYLSQTEPEWAAYSNYIYNIPINTRLEWNQEHAEFILDSSLNVIRYAMSRSEFPTENRVNFVPSTDVVNISNKYNLGYDWNTDPALVLLTPTVPVGYDRAEYRIRINKPNNFRRGDIVTYIPASQTSLQTLNKPEYFVIASDSSSWFEIAESPIHDGRFHNFFIDITNNGAQQFALTLRTGITRATTTYGTRENFTPLEGGFLPADVLYGSTSQAYAEVGSVLQNEAEIIQSYKHYELNNLSTDLQEFANGETLVVQGNTSVNGKILQTRLQDAQATSFVKLINQQGTISQNDVLLSQESNLEGTVTDISDRFLINVKKGAFATGDWFFSKTAATYAKMSEYSNKSGAIIDNTGGKITMDVETIDGAWNSGDIIYGNQTSYILEVKGVSGSSPLTLNSYVHGTNVYELNLGTAIIDTGITDTFSPGDTVYMLQGTVIKEPGFSATVTKYVNGLDLDPGEPNYGVHKLWIANPIDVGSGEPVSAVANTIYSIGKYDINSNFPTIYAPVTSLTDTTYTSYGRVVKIDIAGVTGTIWIENAVGDFLDNMSLAANDGWGAAVTRAAKLQGRVDRYFRGFDGTQTEFSLTISNGESYFPDPAGHLLVFVNGILQPPGGNFAYNAFSDQIRFTEAPEIGSEFVGYYIGKMRQLDDISFEFDSLRSSFNLRYLGIYYSLTLTEGVSSNVIRPENNIIVSLNGVVQEPGVSYEIVGSRIIFSEVPRAGGTFVAFSYIGSDADVIAATVVPPIETGDSLFIEGEEFNREVALIESSNSLITFEYTGSVKGRNAEALARIKKGKVIEALLTNPGDGYTSRPNVDIISSSGFDGRIKALNGIARIDVKTPGTGYAMPNVLVETTVPDDYTEPQGTPVNGGFDVLAGEGAEYYGGGAQIDPGTIAITYNPVNVTVNQGQTASFTVIATVSNSQQLNYQWQKKDYGTTVWSNIIGANQATFSTISAAQADDGDEYRVAITAAGATPVYSNSAILTVQTGATVLSNFSPAQIFDDA